MINKKIVSIVAISVILLVAIVFSIKNSSGENSLEATTGKNQAAISIGVAVPVELLEEFTLFFDGMNMAIEEINSQGGILGKEVEVIIKDDNNDVTLALEIAQYFARNKEIRAVIGHWVSDTTLATAQTYDLNNTILISPTSTSPLLTQQRYENVFRNTMTDTQMGIKIAEYSKKQGYKNIAIYYTDKKFGKNLAKAMEEKCNELGINIIDRHTGFVDKEEFDKTYKKWRYMDADAIFMADLVTDCETIISWIREKDSEIAIMGADGFDIDNFIKILGENSENIAYTSFLNNSDENPKYNDFVEIFKKANDVEPDYWAIKAYDSIYLIKEAMEMAESTTDTDKIRTALKNDLSLEGVNGNYSFDKDGNMIEEKIAIKRVIEGEYVYIFDEK